MTARDEDGDRIMEQVEGQFYLTLDETAQSTNRSDDSPDVYSRGKEAWGPFCPFGYPEQTGPSVESLIAREQHLRIINDAMPCGVVIWVAVDRIIEANKTAEYIFDLSFDELKQHLVAQAQSVYQDPDGTPLPQEAHPPHIAHRTDIAQHNVEEGIIRPKNSQSDLQHDHVAV